MKISQYSEVTANVPSYLVLLADTSTTGNYKMTVSNFTGQMTGAFLSVGSAASTYYPLSNPSGYITSGQTGAFITSGQTGNFIISSQTGSFITTGETGSFITSSQTGSFITTGQTGVFLNTGTASSTYYPLSNPSGYTLNSFITGINVLTSETGISTDVSLGNLFRLTLTGNGTLLPPNNPRDGQRIIYELIQDGTGGRTLALDSSFALGTDITGVTLSTGVNKADYLTCIYNSSASKWRVIGFLKGY